MSAATEGRLPWPGGECRLFVGVAVNGTLQQQLTALQRQIPAELKPVPAQNLHLTLRFLGQSSEAQAEQLWQQLSQQVLPAFTVTFTEVVCWPGPRVLCVAGALTDPALVRLDRQIAQAAQAAGFLPPQHPLHPHVTLARNARHAISLQWQPLLLQPTELHLYQSRTTPEGVRYLPLASLPLSSVTTDN